MVHFTDSPFERLMMQKPEPVRNRQRNVVASSSGHTCSECAYGRDRPCVGACIQRLAESIGKKEKENYG